MRGIWVAALVALLAMASSAGARAAARPARPTVPKTALPLPPVRQATEYTCGPASLLSVLAYFGKGGLGERQLARQARTNYVWGTDERDLARVAKRHGLDVRMQYGMSLRELRSRVRGGRPVMVGLQAWPDHPKTFKPSDNDSGHYAVVIGFDRKRVWFMDPYAPLGTRAYLAIPEFLSRWHWPDSKGIVRPHFAMTLSSPTRKRVRATVSGVSEVQ
jgi:uncharacterized protein